MRGFPRKDRAVKEALSLDQGSDLMKEGRENLLVWTRGPEDTRHALKGLGVMVIRLNSGETQLNTFLSNSTVT